MALPSGNYIYAVTAIDGIGGETTPVTFGISGTGPFTLTWTGIPNAFGYNVYRNSGSGFQLLSTGTAPGSCGQSGQPTQSLPVSAACGVLSGSNTMVYSYTDDGTSAVALAPIVVPPSPPPTPPATQPTPSIIVVANSGDVVQFTVPSTANIPIGQAFTVSGITDAPLNGTYITQVIISPTVFQAVSVGPIPSTASSASGATLTFTTPTSNTTEQTELYKIPGTSAPISYGPPNVIAVFPAPVQRLGVTAIAGNAQQLASQQQQGIASVGIQAKPNGLVPFTVILSAAILSTSSAGASVTEITFVGGLPAPLQVGDHVHVTGTAGHDGTYTVEAPVPAEPPAGRFNVVLLLPPPAPGTPDESGSTSPTIPVGAQAQFELVQVNTLQPYTAVIGSQQTISGSSASGADNYNGTFTVRSGVTRGFSLIIQVPGADLAIPPNLGGGGGYGSIAASGGASASGASGTIAAARAKILPLPRNIRLAPGEHAEIIPLQAPANVRIAPPNTGLVPYARKINTIVEGVTAAPSSLLHTSITFALPLPGAPPSQLTIPPGLQVGDGVRVTNTVGHNFIYNISGGNTSGGIVGPFPAGQSIGTPIPASTAADISIIYCVQAHGVPDETVGGAPTGNPNGTVAIPANALATFGLIHLSLASNQQFTAPTGSQQTISNAADSRYDGTFTVRLGSSTPNVGFNVYVPAVMNHTQNVPLGPSGNGVFGAPVTSGGGGGGQPPPPPPLGPPISGAEAATINSGIVGLLSPVPQMLQFTNRMIMAMGNGWPPYYVPDSSGTAVNFAFQNTNVTLSFLSGGTVSPTGGALVSITIPNVSGVNQPINPFTNGTQFLLTASGFSAIGQVIEVPTITNPNTPATPPTIPGPTFTAYLLVPAGTTVPTSGLTITQTASPLPNNFQVQLPAWAPGIAVNVGDIYVPKTQPITNCAQQGTNQPSYINGVYLQCTQAGVTGGTEPTWPNPCSQGTVPPMFPIKNIVDNAAPIAPVTGAPGPGGATTTGGPIWEEVGFLNGLNPPVPGASHAAVYSSCLFLFNTYPHQTGSQQTGWGMDGPTSLRQSDPNNPFSWNPASQVFIDKDDGSEGMALSTFTIAAVGIPPIGSLFLFKNYAPYQLTGLFQAGITIARVRSERGCIAPRTAKFVPGYGIGRLTHLGVSITDGVTDQLLSDTIRPYLFAVNDRTTIDIQFMDPPWAPYSYADLTANPPMYCCAIPVGQGGNSLGALNRALCYDLTQRGWYPVDFPFTISVFKQVLLTTLAPVTLLGGWQDGLIQRWQYGDFLWETVSASTTPAGFDVEWYYRTPLAASQNPDQRVYFQELSIKGVNSHVLGPITAVPVIDGLAQPMTNTIVQSRGTGGDILVVVPILVTGQRCYCDIFGAGGIEIDSGNYHLVAKPLAGRLVIA